MVDLYKKGFVIQYEDNDEISLERKRVDIITDINDSIHIVKEDDTIESISYQYYKNSFLWYIIADVNDIDNPFFLDLGSSLTIPNINTINNV